MKTIYSLILFFFFSGLTAVAQSDTDTQDTDNLWEEGKDLYYDGNYEEAEKIFEEVLRLRLKIFRPTQDPVLAAYYRLGKNERRLRSHQKALQTLKSGLKYAKKAEKDQKLWVADFYNEIAIIYDQMFDLEQSNKYYRKAIKAYTDVYGEKSLEVADIYLNTGYSLTKRSYYRQAKVALDSALVLYKLNSEPNSKDFNRIYNNLSIYYYKIEDYDKSLNYALNALHIKLLNYSDNHPSVAKYHINVAKAYAALDNYEEGLKHSKKAAYITKNSLGETHSETASAQAETAHFYAALGETEKALAIYQNSWRVMEAHIGADHPSTTDMLYSIAELYEKQGNYAAALQLYRQSSLKPSNLRTGTESIFAANYTRMAEIFLKTNHADSALIYVGIAMENISKNFKYKSGKEDRNPTFKNIQSDIDFFYLLELKADIFIQLHTQKEKFQDLKNAEISLTKAVKLIEKMRKSYSSDKSQEALNTRIAPLLKKAVHVSFSMWKQTGESIYLHNALDYSEMSKASILWLNMNENLARSSANIPAELSRELDDLSKHIQELETITKSNIDSIQYSTFSSQLFDTKADYERKISELEQVNPRYFDIKYATPRVNLKTLRAQIPDEHTLLIEYFYEGNNLYIFTVGKSEMNVVKTPFSNKDREAILFIKDYDFEQITASDAHFDYQARLQKLYNSLITPIETQINLKKSLVFVPHGILNYLPFEILTPRTEETDFRKMPYLLKDYTIHYAWSLAFYQSKTKNKATYIRDFTGFAPVFKQVDSLKNSDLSFRNDLSALPKSKEEVISALNYFSGEIFTDADASETKFQSEAANSRILHLATHARTDDHFPLQSGLYFASDKHEDGFLNLHEIYNMQISAELAVMSACDTGTGKTIEGEGVISLGRAFSYAGCASVAMSLWQANDQSTSDLMSAFYKNLSTGSTKAEALRQAKLDYLTQADPLTAHPYFWASMVATGDMRPMRSNNYQMKYFLGLGLIFFGILFWLIFRIHFNSNKAF